MEMRPRGHGGGNARKGCANGRGGGKNGQRLPGRLCLGRALQSTRQSLLQGVWPVVLRRPLRRCGLASVRRRIARSTDGATSWTFPTRPVSLHHDCESQSAPHRPTSEPDRSRACLAPSHRQFAPRQKCPLCPTSSRLSDALQPSHLRGDVTDLTRLALIRTDALVPHPSVRITQG